METLTSCISFTHSWACFAEYGTEISSDVNDGCPSAGRTSEPPFRGLATSVWNGLHLQSGGLNHSHCDTGYIEKTLRAESLSCQRNDMSERRKYFTGTNEKKQRMRGHFRNLLSYASLWPPDRFNSLTMLSSISFNFSGVYNVISAEDLTRSLSFNWFCWESVERPSLSQNATPSILYSTRVTASSSSSLFQLKCRFLVNGHNKLQKINSEN